MSSIALTFSYDLEPLAHEPESFISTLNPELFIASKALSL